MSADLLRRAAALMRERAGAATPSPWTRMPLYNFVKPDVASLPFTASSEQNAEHIASWHPAVALAVAHWLDQYAAVIEAEHPIAFDESAIAVATVYLNEEPA